MTIKSLLLCLFLYVCLAWVGAALLYQGPDILHYGLLWTAIGLIAVLAFIIGVRLFGWWRLWRAKAAARPAPAMRPVPSIHPDDVAMSALIAEASATLAKAPSFAGRRGGALLSGMPLYLLIGPEGSGKTSAFLNSATEPQLLAGEGTAPVAPTRLCNIWLAKDAVFAEIGGRAFAGELSRWSQLLGVLRGQVAIPLWRRLWGEPEPQMDLRGVIAFCDSKELTGASSDPQRLERYSRDWQERLRSIAERFGAEFPVYLIITKCDKIPFFSDFFRRLPESEVNQVLGCTLPAHQAQTSRPHEVFVEAEAKRLAASFRPLYHALTRRRLTQLAHEPNPAVRPGVYEFPREFKRIRSPLVQFLTDVFRPSSLGPSPVLRGYYLTGVRETALEIHDPAGRRMDSATQAPMEATRLFRGDATQIFQGDDLSKAPGSGGRPALGLRWMFVADLFHRVILADQPPRRPNPLDGRVEQYRKLAFGAVCGLCALLCLAFLVSWVNNRNLLYDIGVAASSQTNRQGRATSLQDLKALDALRVQVVRLQGHVPWSFRWGLYSGDRVLDQVRTAYFRQFQRLLLIDLNGQMMADLERLPPNPDAGAPYDPAFRTLKAHLMITSGSCAVDSPFLSRQLKDVRARIAPDAVSEWQALADLQIDFYANELPRGNPLHLAEDIEGRERARQYLRQLNGIDRFYATILANAEKSLGKSSRLSDLASNYTQVLTGPDEVSAAFSREGWAYVEKASREINAAALGEACVLGGASGLVAGWKENTETAQAIQRMFLRNYVDHWRKFVEGFSVTKYASAGDAARRLEILADHKSPLLAVFVMTANHTNFPGAATQTDAGALQKGVINAAKKSFSELVGSATKAAVPAKAVVGTSAENPDTLNNPADITPYFQPVQAVEPPGSETWVVDKNAAYIDTLAQLRRSMQDIDQGGRNQDPAVHQLAGQNYEKAMDTVRQIARGFKPVGVGGLDTTVEHLLEEPILLTKPFIIKDMEKTGLDKLNRELRNFCTSEQNTLRKYPFKSSSTDDATREEFGGMFDPVKGAIWAFQRQFLTDLTVKEGSLWKPKDPTRKPQITQELLGFLNRAQSIVEVFYAGGGTPMQFNYTLRPRLDIRLKEFTLELEIDGQPYQWTNNIQHQFNWPPPEGTKNPGAVARLRTSTSAAIPVASQGGMWGIFRVFGDAEPRDLNARVVEWKYTRTGLGRREPLDPPVQLDIVDFPRGQDVFNPKFWDGLRCPSVAVQ